MSGSTATMVIAILKADVGFGLVPYFSCFG